MCIRDRAENAPYLTRLMTVIDPEEMTIDPMFTFDDSLDDVSNVRDARELQGLFDCERVESFQGRPKAASDAINADFVNQEIIAGTFTSYDELPEQAFMASYHPEDGPGAGPATTLPGDDNQESGEGETALDAIGDGDGSGTSAAWFIVPLVIVALGAVALSGFLLGKARPGER